MRDGRRVFVPAWSQRVEQFVAGTVTQRFVEPLDEQPLAALPELAGVVDDHLFVGCHLDQLVELVFGEGACADAATMLRRVADASAVVEQVRAGQDVREDARVPGRLLPGWR